MPLLNSKLTSENNKRGKKNKWTGFPKEGEPVLFVDKPQLSYCHVETALLDFVLDVATPLLALVTQNF